MQNSEDVNFQNWKTWSSQGSPCWNCYFHGQKKKKKKDICPSVHNMGVPNIQTHDYQLIRIQDSCLPLPTETDEVPEDLKLPEGEVGK